jgi:hypothetical protein
LIKECNVLGNGPSRKSYIPNDLPSIGCNCPWCKVDWVIVADPEIIKKSIDDKLYIPSTVKILLGEGAYRILKSENLFDKIKSQVIGIYKHPIRNGLKFTQSSAHFATEWMISQGFNKINIYGCDNYFGDLLNLDSYTHEPGTLEYKQNELVHDEQERILRGKDWQKAWHIIINKNPNIEFNFVK